MLVFRWTGNVDLTSYSQNRERFRTETAAMRQLQTKASRLYTAASSLFLPCKTSYEGRPQTADVLARVLSSLTAPTGWQLINFGNAWALRYYVKRAIIGDRL